MKKEVTKEEDELLEAIRNYKKGRHNPSIQLYEHAVELFFLLLDE